MGELFKEGRPSNMLSEVGLTIHCFDGTEDYSAPWKPCLSGHCPQGGDWWSGSIINAKQPHTLSASGIVTSRSSTSVVRFSRVPAGVRRTGAAPAPGSSDARAPGQR